ncbi:hypothetical protein THTE_1031 [Thermogutta terrifontis]|uniref:Uncharacterized protein n=1 Tax=Thermogutta terrifontis TaxID=1331910 RepID=A0A286RCF0_9BACT|nr:hypothetical protein THTE_1031 [Thermogutta terrifontis]
MVFLLHRNGTLTVKLGRGNFARPPGLCGRVSPPDGELIRPTGPAFCPGALLGQILPDSNFW